MRKRLRIFISSPGDVNEERLRAHLVIQKLARDYARFFEIDAYLWEHEPMLASGHFQDAIEPPSASDIVLLVVYARLGTSLPERTATREYRGIDGRAPVTGTEWEFEEALAANRLRGAPDLLAYRKVGDPGLSLTDAARRAEQERQWQNLESFWQRHFENAGMFLAGSQRFSTVEEFDRKLEADLTALIERRIAEDMAGGDSAGGVRAEEPRWLKGSPFRGLSAYDFDDAEIFFGRDAQTRQALGRLQAAAERGTAFLMVLGASGSGKSSLARAGILPALSAPKAVPGVGVWRRVVFRPADGGDDPVRGLALALTAGDPARGVGLPELIGPGAAAEALAAHLAASADDPTYPFQQALGKVAEEARKARRMLPHEQARVVILIDQIEELFTRGVAPERRDQFLRIVAALSRSGLAWVIATMRSDLWHRAAEARLLLELVDAGARLDVPQPDGAEIIEIVRRPAAAAGIAFDADPETGVALDAVIARAASEEPGVLPLLSVLLDTLYERDVAAGGRGPRHVLSFETYRALGELKGAIAQRADQALARLREHDPEAADALPRVLRALVTVSAGSAVTARPARLDAFPEGSPEARLIAAFLAPDARLLVASAHGDVAEVRLAHEALLENWPTAREQIKTDRRDLETRARLEALHRRWRDAPQAAEKKKALLTGLNLAEGSDLMARWTADRDGELGAFVAASARADRLRRSWFAASAAALALVFAGIAGFAALESRRAEREADSALAAAAAERTAREDADRQRDRADTERERAVASEQKTAAALRATKRQAARALAAQAGLATGAGEFRRALTLAVEAGDTERDALDPGEASASEPALLRAVADVRQVLHVRRPTGGLPMPYMFLGDQTLVHVDQNAGLVITDVGRAPRLVARTPLPDDMVPLHLAVLPATRLVAVAGDARLFVVDAGDGRIVHRATLPSRITGLDIHAGSRRLAIAMTGGLAFLDLADGTLSEPVAIETGDTAIGQVHFSRAGDRLYLTIGTRIRVFDVATRALADDDLGELDGSSAGFDKPLLENILAKAILRLVHLAPDPTRDRLLTWHIGDVGVVAAGAPAKRFEREDRAFQVRGVSFTDSAGKGELTDAVAVLVRRSDTSQEIELRFIGDDPKLLTFERLSVAADDYRGDSFDTCIVSMNAGHLACAYWSRTRAGLVVFKLRGGPHRFERVFGEPGASWGGLMPGGGTLVGKASQIVAADGSAKADIGTLPDDFAPVALRGPYLAGASKDRIGIWRVDPKARDGGLKPVVAPAAATRYALDPERRRAVLATAQSLAVYDLDTGRRIAAVPGLDGLRGVALSRDASRVAALTDQTVYLFDAGTGRLAASTPVEVKEDAPFAFDAALRHVAIVTAKDAIEIIDIATGASRSLGDGMTASVLLWPADGGPLLVGHRDGAVTALEAASGETLWRIASPLGPAFSEGNAWPGQPPKGFVRALALSSDGVRLAVVRQDLPAVDLHEAASGRALTRLGTPWAFGVPGGVSLGDDGRALTIWALHAMTIDRPGHVALHALPFGLDAALAAAKARLAGIEAVFSPALEPQPE